MFRNAFLVLTFTCVIYGVVNYLAFLGFFNGSFKHHPGECRKVKGARYGSEDMAWTRDGLVFITTGLSISDVEKHMLDTGTHGEIQLFDFKHPDAGVVDLKIQPTRDLDIVKMRPHGITIQEDLVKGEHILHVINHRKGETRQESVEKFRFHPSSRQLTHLKTIQLDDSLFFNNIAALEGDQFYITNFAYMPVDSIFYHALINLFPVKIGSLHFYNGTKSVAVTPRMSTPNGVAVSPDKKYVYVMATNEHTLYVYKRDKTNTKPSLIQTVNLGIKGDNLNFTPEGDALLLGCHPVFYKSILHLFAALNPERITPSSVLRIPLGKDGMVVESDITELFYDYGDLISGSSSAASYKGQLLIGSVANSLVHCQA